MTPSVATSLPVTDPVMPRLDRWGLAATVSGNALEFYDFIAYSTFAVYIGRNFFPAADALASLLLSLATFGIGFLTRPLGALLIGAYADRAGRRPALLLTIGLMTSGTVALVLTPSYARIGLAAPIILALARLVQGVALGGEVGASTALLLEAAPMGRRGRFVSWQGASQGAAVLAAGLFGFGLSLLLTPAQMGDWGWRVPFALGLAIVPVGLYVRRRLPETLLVRGSRGGGAVLLLLWRQQRRQLLLAMLILMSLTISTYVNNYMTTYALTSLGMPASQALFATIVNGLMMLAGSVLAGRLADHFGCRAVMVLPRVALILLICPAFLLLVKFPRPFELMTVTALVTAISSLSGTAALTTITSAFPSEVRSCGLAVAYAAAVSLFGSTTQLIVAWLIGTTGDRLAPAYYVIATSIVGLWAMLRLPQDSGN